VVDLEVDVLLVGEGEPETLSSCDTDAERVPVVDFVRDKDEVRVAVDHGLSDTLDVLDLVWVVDVLDVSVVVVLCTSLQVDEREIDAVLLELLLRGDVVVGVVDGLNDFTAVSVTLVLVLGVGVSDEDCDELIVDVCDFDVSVEVLTLLVTETDDVSVLESCSDSLLVSDRVAVIDHEGVGDCDVVAEGESVYWAEIV